ncbi:toxin-antitoxin system YwqK family antitoxin [Parabacteroides sp. PF5-9]|uniref:toxin-antitoxin system YwqK family antitoxin n=1 Tax=Parabacteroides sp. PF5-9 TaxID=1742404 RepID=UPI0024756308|nr:toxin-antitoxin system YwqK family antitoxin [Parabacteroides sp. PF5-9]
MKKSILLLIILCGFFMPDLSAQNEFNIEEITVINLGDGRYLHRRKSDDKPIDGERRIIDGRRSEYKLATFKDGLYDGKYQHFKYNKLTEEGTYKEGRKDGIFKEYTSDGVTLKNQKSYKEGKTDGLWISYYTNGEPEREKNYKNGLEDGVERKYDYESGALITEMNFVDGKKHGKQRQQITSNHKDYVIDSNYEMGVLNGKYSETYVDNGIVRKEGVYKNGKEEGVWLLQTTDGMPEKELRYKNGKLDGECKTKFFTDGSVSEIEHYKEGKRHGLSTSFLYQKKGKVQSETNYVDGKKEGLYKKYNQEGNLYEEGRIENGKLVFQKEYFSNGKLRTKKELKDGRLETTEKYDENGNKI